MDYLVANKDKKMKKRILSIVALAIVLVTLLPFGEVFALVKDYVEVNTINVTAPKQPEMVKNTASVTMTKKIPTINALGTSYYKDLTITSMTNGDIMCTFGDTHFTMRLATNPTTELYSLNDKSKTSVSTNGIWTDLDNVKYPNKTLVEFRGTATSTTQKVSFIPKAGKETWVTGKTFYVGTKDAKTGKPAGDVIGFNWDDAKQAATFDNAKGELSFNVVSGQAFLIDPSVVVTTTDFGRVGYYVTARQSFYANGRHWVFYASSATVLSYKTSTDGSSWSAATDIVTITQPYFYSDLYFDGTYLHYALKDGSVYLLYRRGVPNADGTITWSAAQQTVLGWFAHVYNAPTIIVDTAGIAYIGYGSYNGTINAYDARVIRNDNIDGTWATTAGYPITLRAGDMNGQWHVRLAMQSAAKIYAIYGDGNHVEVYGRQYNAGWGAETTIRSDLYSNSATLPFVGSLTSITTSDDVHYAYVSSSTGIYSRTYSGGVWGAAVLINDTVDSNTSTPTISLYSATGDVIVFWVYVPDGINQHIYYKKRIGGVWDVNPTNWVSVLFGQSGYYISSYYRILDGIIGFLYVSGAGSPYDINYAFLAPTVAPTVTTQAASSVTGSTARLNGYVDSDGGEEVVATFSWDVHTHSCNMTAYANTANVTGTFATGETPFYDIGTLSCNTTYFYCMRGSNSFGQDSGGELTFTTSACAAGTSGYAPNTLVGVATDTTISLNWISANVTAFNLVRYGMGCGTTCTVTSNTTGTMTYNGTLTYSTTSGLTPGTAYCWYVFGNGYSSANATLCLSTLPSAATTNTIPTPPQPTGWFQAPDHTTQVSNPLYAPINLIGSYLGMPLANFWMFVAILFSIAGAIIALIIFKNLWVASTVLLMLITLGWQQKLIPLAILVPVGIAVSLTIYYSFRGRTA
jgi:hypothetical protein